MKIAMGRVRWLLAAVAMVLVLSLARGAGAQGVGPGELPELDAGTRAAVVDAVCKEIAKVYVLGEPAGRIVAHLRQQLDSGAYDALVDPVELVRRLQNDAQAVNHDGHFGLRVLRPEPDAPAANEEDPERERRRQRAQRERNYGFEKVELLPGNVGYLKLEMFSGAPEALPVAAAAMNFLAGSDALIIDLRTNGGGSAAMIRMLATYLFEERVHLINWYVREDDEVEQSRTLDFVPGARIPDIPVYVLTSSLTFSAAEEFTFDLKHLERATVVGETTGGGGHTVATRFADFEGFRVGMRLPYGRAYDPETGNGWEGVGVQPDVEVPAEEALATAHRLAVEARLEAEQDDQYRNRFEWVLQDLDSRENPIELGEEEMAAYVGSYGPRRILIEDGVLYYQREGRPRLRLEPMAEDLFRVGHLEFFRLGFTRDDDGKIDTVVGFYDDGNRDENARDE